MNTAAKGYRKEYFIRKKLEADGWKIVFKSVRFKFGCLDFASLFDVISYKGQLRKYISSKHLGNSNYYLPHQGDIRRFKEEHGKEGESYELWLWDKPRWKGRGKNKVWHQGGFEVIEI